MIYWLSTNITCSTKCKAAAAIFDCCFFAFLVEAVQTVVAMTVLADLVADDGLLVSPTHFNLYDVAVCVF